MKYRQFATFFIATAVAVLAVFVAWPSAKQTQAAPSTAAAPGWQQTGAANPFAAGQVSEVRMVSAANTQSLPAPDMANTSLAGTQPDGDWGVNALGYLRASRALRQRFDYYLSLAGEMPLASIVALFRQAAEKDLKEPALSQVLALWSRFVQLQQHPWKHAVNVQKPDSWSAALSERQIQRRQLLGADVAAAFYAEEEGQLQQMLMRLQAGQGGQSGKSDRAEQSVMPATAATHPQASEREAALQAQWQHWEQRLQAARSQLQAYKLAPELSAPQRQQAIEHYLASQFLGTELVRARALLGV